MTSPARYAVLGLCGIAFWFAAALFIRFTLPLGWFHGGPATVVLFAASAAAGAGLVELMHAVVRGAPGERIRTAAVLCLAGTVLDGLAITWAGGLYDPARAAPAGGAAWLLFGVGTILLWAMVRDRPRRP